MTIIIAVIPLMNPALLLRKLHLPKDNINNTTTNMSRLLRLNTRGAFLKTTRPFSTTLPIYSDGIGKDKTHTVNKHDEPNVQTDASKQGMEYAQHFYHSSNEVSNIY